MKRRPDDGTHAEHEPPTLQPTIVALGRTVARCQWYRRATGRQCRKAAANGRNFCRTHRGNVVQIGPANPAWTGGRWSRLLPVSMQLTEPPDLSHRPILEVLDGRGQYILRQIKAKGGSSSEFTAAFGRLTAAMSAGNSDEIRWSMQELRTLADGSAASDKLWNEFDRLMRQRQKLIDAERRFVLDARNVLTREQAQAHASALVAAIVRHVKDRDTLNAIMEDIRQLVEVPAAR